MEASRVVGLPPAPANSEDIAASLEAQSKALQEQATTLLARAERLAQIAEQVRDAGLRAGGRVLARPDLTGPGAEATLEVKIRGILTSCDLATEDHLAEQTGVPVKALRPILEELAGAGKVASLRRRGERIYSWLYPDGRGDAPRDAPTQEGRVLAEVRRDGAMIDTDRGKPVRLVTSNRDRRARSTPGVRHKMKLKDAAYERQEAAKVARAEEQQRKAAQPKGKK
jgi:hypothetical protein